MKLSRLLEFHRGESPNGALSRNLGDGYLIRHNQIYGNIRRLALEPGFKPSTDFNPDYLALPLGQLDQILDSKLLPFVDNVSALETLVQRLGQTVTWNDVSDNLRRNQLFHESCHAVFRVKAIARGFRQNQRSGENIILEALLEESFDNACEFLAVVDATKIEHQIFLTVNSYTSLFEETRALQNLTAAFGRAAILKFMILSYLLSNGLQEAITKPLVTKLFQLSFPETPPAVVQKHSKTLLHMAKLALTLDERFRGLVTPLYLKMNMTPTSAAEIARTDWLAAYESSARHQDLLAALIKDFSFSA